MTKPSVLRILLRTYFNLTLITSLLVSCAGIPANKVKVSDYPEVKKEEVRQLDISYVYNDFVEKRKGDDPAKIDITTEAKLIKFGIKKNSEKQNTKCKIVTSMSSGAYDFLGCPIFTNILSIPTLTIIPYYCQIGFRGGAVLIETRTNKVLKSYEIKDKVHEIWSLLWFLSTFVVDPHKYSNSKTPKGAKDFTEDQISEALVRSILNDAFNFKECKKTN